MAERRSATVGPTDVVVLVATLLVASVFVLANDGPAALFTIPVLLALLALRARRWIVSMAVGTLGAAAVLVTLADRGPFVRLADHWPVSPLLLSLGFIGCCVVVARGAEALHSRARLATSTKRLDEDIYRLIANGSHDIVFVTNTVGSVRFVSPAVSLQLGVPEDALTSREWDRYVHPDDRAGVAGTFAAIRSGAVTAEHTLRMRHADGSFRWFELRLRRTRSDEDVASLNVVGTLRDITERKIADDELEAIEAHAARRGVTDALTGLANSRVLDNERERAWRQAVSAHTPLTMMVIDIDLLGAFNARDGRDAGDRAVVLVARVITGAIERSADLCARYRGDQFVALLPGATIDRAEAVAATIRRDLAAGAMPHSDSPSGILTVSIGIATMCPSDGASTELHEQAVAALYLAKSRGRDRVELIDASGNWRR